MKQEGNDFEIWARANALDTTKLPHGAYRSMTTHFAHKAWKTRDVKLIERMCQFIDSNMYDAPGSASERARIFVDNIRKELYENIIDT